MEITVDTIIAILGLFIGGGGGAFFTWRWQRKKAKAEAENAEIDAAKELQDMYQQMLADAKTDREDRKAQIEELRAERDHYKNDRNELRDRLDATDEKIRVLEHTVARNGRQIEAMRPFMCYVSGCRKRQLVEVLDHAASKKHEIEPNNEE